MRAFWHAVLSLLILAGVSQVSRCAEPPWSGGAGDTPLVPEKVRQPMQDRDYAKAIQAIDEAAQAKEAPGDYLAYLRGWALYLSKEYDAAIAAFVRSEKEFP